MLVLFQEEAHSGPYALETRWPTLDGHFAILRMQNSAAEIDRLFYAISMAGWCGVDIVLSSFLITGILLDAKGSSGFFTTFYMRRLLRIFPLFYGFLFLCLIIVPNVVPVSHGFKEMFEQQGWYWAYLINIPLAAERHWRQFLGFSHLWSLAVEEQFYLF